MSTRIRVSTSQNKLASVNAAQTTANRSNRLNEQSTKEQVKDTLDPVALADANADDARYPSKLREEPAAFARKKVEPGQVYAIGIVGLQMQLSDNDNFGCGYRYRSLSLQGYEGDPDKLGAWELANFDHPYEKYIADDNTYKVRFSDNWNIFDDIQDGFVSSEGYADWSVPGGRLAKENESPMTGRGVGMFSTGIYTSGWSITFNTPAQTNNFPARYVSPLNFSSNYELLGNYDSFYNDPQYLSEDNKWNPTNLFPYAFTYLLPYKDDHAFLVVACVDIRCPLYGAPLHSWSYTGSTLHSYPYEQTLDPESSVLNGTYYGITASYTYQGNKPFAAKAFDIQGGDVTLSSEGRKAFADIHIYSVKHGEVVRIDPPQAVIDNLRQFMHPDPLIHGTVSDTMSTADGGAYSYKSTAYPVSLGPYGTSINDMGESEKTTSKPFSPTGGGDHTYSIPNLAAYNAHVEKTMPLWDATNEERCLNFQYGMGSILSNSHSELRDEQRNDKRWGGFNFVPSGGRSSRYVPIPKQQEWFRYFTPAIYSTIRGQTRPTHLYQQFVSHLPSGKTVLTGKNNSKLEIEYPPKFIVNANTAGTLMVTDPAQWPESLPVSTTSSVQPVKLVESDSIGYENLEKATHLAWNWSNPWYCWDELVRLGFTTAELGPRPQSEFPDTDFGPSPDEEEPNDEESTD